MRYFTLFPLQGYWGKFAGLAISTLALILIGIYKLTGPEFLNAVLPAGKQLGTLLWLFAMGLYFISFSKEKVDDERVQKIRYTALRGTGLIVFGMLFISFSPMALNAKGISEVAITDPIFLIFTALVLPLLAYQVIFNIGLHLNPAWAFNDLGVEENIKKNRKFFLIYIILTALLLVGLVILNSLEKA